MGLELVLVRGIGSLGFCLLLLLRCICVDYLHIRCFPHELRLLELIEHAGERRHLRQQLHGSCGDCVLNGHTCSCLILDIDCLQHHGDHRDILRRDRDQLPGSLHGCRHKHHCGVDDNLPCHSYRDRHYLLGSDTSHIQHQCRSNLIDSRLGCYCLLLFGKLVYTDANCLQLYFVCSDACGLQLHFIGNHASCLRLYYFGRLGRHYVGRFLLHLDPLQHDRYHSHRLRLDSNKLPS